MDNSLFLSQSAAFGNGLRGISSPLPPPSMSSSLLSSFGFSPMFSAFVDPYLANRGFNPLSGNGMNPMDALRRVEQQQARQDAVQAAATLDQPQFYDTVRGGFALAGVPFGADQQQFATQLSSAAVQASPMLAMMNPGMLDRMAGRTGSAAVLAGSLYDVGQFALNPATGSVGGMSAAQIAAQTQGIMDTAYSDPMSFGFTSGMSAGDLGQAFRYMSAKGMTGSDMTHEQSLRQAISSLNQDSSSSLRLAAQRQGVEMPTNVSQLDLEQLTRLGQDDTVVERLGNIDGQRIARQFEGYAKALGAVQEIFSANGRPDAPMNQIIGALENLTQGGMNRFSGDQLEGMVRQTSALADMLPGGIDQMMVIQQHSAHQAARAGLDPSLAVSVGQSTAAGLAAFNQLGYGGHPGFGMPSAEQFAAADSSMRVQGLASDQGNRRAFLASLGSEGFLEAGSDAMRAYEAIRAGQGSFTNGSGDTVSLNMGTRQMSDLIMGGTDLTRNQVFQGMRFTVANQKIMGMEGFSDSLAASQGDEFVSTVQRGVEDLLAQSIVDSTGVSNAEARRQAALIGAETMKGLGGLTAEQLADPTKRNKAMQGLISGALETTGLQGSIAENQLDQLGALAFGSISQVSQETFGQSASTMLLTRVSDRVRQQSGMNTFQASIDAGMASASSVLTSSGGMREIATSLQQMNPGDGADIPALVASFVGAGYVGGEKQTELESSLSSVFELRKEVETATNAYNQSGGTDNEARKAALAAKDRYQKAVADFAKLKGDPNVALASRRMDARKASKFLANQGDASHAMRFESLQQELGKLQSEGTLDGVYSDKLKMYGSTAMEGLNTATGIVDQYGGVEALMASGNQDDISQFKESIAMGRTRTMQFLEGYAGDELSVAAQLTRDEIEQIDHVQQQISDFEGLTEENQTDEARAGLQESMDSLSGLTDKYGATAEELFDARKQKMRGDRKNKGMSRQAQRDKQLLGSSANNLTKEQREKAMAGASKYQQLLAAARVSFSGDDRERMTDKQMVREYLRKQKESTQPRKKGWLEAGVDFATDWGGLPMMAANAASRAGSKVLTGTSRSFSDLVGPQWQLEDKMMREQAGKELDSMMEAFEELGIDPTQIESQEDFAAAAAMLGQEETAQAAQGGGQGGPTRIVGTLTIRGDGQADIDASAESSEYLTG